MHPTRFSCPHCSAPLRVRDRMFVGKRVGCPDCGGPILIAADGPKGFAAEKAEPAAHESPPLAKERMGGDKVPPGSQRRPADDRQHRLQEKTGTPGASEPALAAPYQGGELSATRGRRKQRRPVRARTRSTTRCSRWPAWLAVLATPVGIAWTVAGSAAIVLLAVVFGSGSAGSQESEPTADEPGAVSEESGGADDLADAAAKPPQPEAAAPVADDLDAALGEHVGRLGRLVAGYAEANGRFPAAVRPGEGLPPDGRFGWLAEVAAEMDRDRALVPQWDRPWHDPLNDRFVRRAIAEFQNPLVARRVSEDGYPAGHFAGVAGVGPDAPELPADHPRAGVFGYDRRTRLEDVQDGLSQTMMIAGVDRRVGSWASGGRATIRAFIEEPYVNGPDGFGTGQPDRMLVLMADGSVRTVSGDTEPTIIRRMAAMSDGLPLDPRVPGEPGDRRPRSAAEPKSAVRPLAHAEHPVAKPVEAARPNAGNEDPETAVARPEPPRKIDVAGQLSQPIVRFEQLRPVPLRELLVQIEELSGVPLRYADELTPDAAPLDERVTISLQETTVGGVLEALLKQTGLTYEIEADGIRIASRKVREERQDD